MKRRKKPFIILAVILVVVLLVAGYIKFFNGRLIYFTTGMKSGELIKTAGQKTTYTCEADILMSDVKKEYEEMFGSNIWREKIGDADFESYIKDQIKSKLMRVKAMNVKAKERGVVLGREEKDSVGKAVDAFYNELTESQISSTGITKDKLNTMFTEFAIAQTRMRQRWESWRKSSALCSWCPLRCCLQYRLSAPRISAPERKSGQGRHCVTPSS